MKRCRKGSNRVVVGHDVNVKHKVDDQTIIDNCRISKTKIGSVESVNSSFPRYSVGTVRRTHVVICYCYWSFDYLFIQVN